MISKTKTEHYLRNIELPEDTETYTVIPHSFIIDTTRKLLEKNGFDIEEELYKASSKGQEASGFVMLKTEDDEDMSMTFNWTNSYNKQLRFQCSIGGFIFDNDTPFISSKKQTAWTRKHTGTALEEAEEVMKQMIEQAGDHFKNIIAMKDKLKAIEISRKDYAKICGLLFFDKQVILNEQSTIIKNEYDNPSFNYKDKGTLWELYKMIMFAIRENGPKQWYKQQMQINSYIQIMYQVASADDFSLKQEEVEDIPVVAKSINLHALEPVETTLEEDLNILGEKFKETDKQFDDDVKFPTPEPEQEVVEEEEIEQCVDPNFGNEINFDEPEEIVDIVDEEETVEVVEEVEEVEEVPTQEEIVPEENPIPQSILDKMKNLYGYKEDEPIEVTEQDDKYIVLITNTNEVFTVKK